jgi:dimethylhistidine N-methyltransferase
MTSAEPTNLPLYDQEPGREDVAGEVLAGLKRQPKQLPSKLFYDQRGSQLFEQITEQPEYYLTRTELAIMRDHAPAMARQLGPRARLVELGSGSSRKTRLLLDHLPDPACYIPVDISRQHLLASARQLAEQYPGLPVLPVCADYTRPFELPTPTGLVHRTAVYFPGSTLGNFHHDHARRFLKDIACMVGLGGALLIGIDLQKDPDTLVAAYNDAAGVTAAFNYNLLHRINRDAPADFDVNQFRHRPCWNADEGRMESHLVSEIDQTVTVAAQTIQLAAGEPIWVECSYKYTFDGFADLAEDFLIEQVWQDPNHYFAVLLLIARPGQPT